MNNARHPKRDPNQSRVSENMILLSVTKNKNKTKQNKTDNPPELLIMCHKRKYTRGHLIVCLETQKQVRQYFSQLEIRFN